MSGASGQSQASGDDSRSRRDAARTIPRGFSGDGRVVAAARATRAASWATTCGETAEEPGAWRRDCVQSRYLLTSALPPEQEMIAARRGQFRRRQRHFFLALMSALIQLVPIGAEKVRFPRAELGDNAGGHESPEQPRRRS